MYDCKCTSFHSRVIIDFMMRPSKTKDWSTTTRAPLSGCFETPTHPPPTPSVWHVISCFSGHYLYILCFLSCFQLCHSHPATGSQWVKLSMLKANLNQMFWNNTSSWKDVSLRMWHYVSSTKELRSCGKKRPWSTLKHLSQASMTDRVPYHYYALYFYFNLLSVHCEPFWCWSCLCGSLVECQSGFYVTKWAD